MSELCQTCLYVPHAYLTKRISAQPFPWVREWWHIIEFKEEKIVFGNACLFISNEQICLISIMRYCENFEEKIDEAVSPPNSCHLGVLIYCSVSDNLVDRGQPKEIIFFIANCYLFGKPLFP